MIEPSATTSSILATALPKTPDGLWFGKDLSSPDPIPEAAIARALELMRGGRLHRYGEQGPGKSEVSLLEEDFAHYVGSPYCMAVSSCGAAMFLALKALGVKAGDKVLTSSFTLAPVPGAIAHAGGLPVLVETLNDYTTDLVDLKRKLESTQARVFLISHMRGHITDMQAVRQLCDQHGAKVVEDCAHTMGAQWNGQHTGTWGDVGCYSTQTYKHINSGEGGLLVTEDADIAAQVILMSGCYMMYGQHSLRPPDAVFERWKYITPNFSMRMSNLAAALLRPQMAMLEARASTWKRIYAQLETRFNRVTRISVPARRPQESFVASSIQFSVDLPPPRLQRFVDECDRRGLYIKWFGKSEPLAFTSNYQHWHYIGEIPVMPQSDMVLLGLMDMRLPLSLSEADCDLIGTIVATAAEIAASRIDTTDF